MNDQEEMNKEVDISQMTLTIKVGEGESSVIKFEDDLDKRREYRRAVFSDLDQEETDRISEERTEALDHFEAHNDVVCDSMKLGQED
jgi:hypothetical protein